MGRVLRKDKTTNCATRLRLSELLRGVPQGFALEERQAKTGKAREPSSVPLALASGGEKQTDDPICSCTRGKSSPKRLFPCACHIHSERIQNRLLHFFQSLSHQGPIVS